MNFIKFEGISGDEVILAVDTISSVIKNDEGNTQIETRSGDKFYSSDGVLYIFQKINNSN